MAIGAALHVDMSALKPGPTQRAGAASEEFAEKVGAIVSEPGGPACGMRSSIARELGINIRSLPAVIKHRTGDGELGKKSLS